MHNNNIDILENELIKKYPGVLEALLRDHTTQKNIFWATENYKELGDSYQYHSEILPECISGENGNVIMPRVKKDKDLQQSRVRDMAEVFTPSWICNVTPARFLFNAGKTPKKWNNSILNDKHFKVVWYESNSTDVFPNVDIKGGVAVGFRNSEETFGKIGVFSKYREVSSILEKVEVSNGSLSDLVYAPESYRFSKELHKAYPQIKEKLSKGHLYDLTTNIFDRLDVVFFLECPKDENQYIQIYGRQNNVRLAKWIRNNFVDKHPNLNSFKVVLPKSNGSGKLGEYLSKPFIAHKGTGHNQTFISIGKFDEESEAMACLKYIKSKFSRLLLGTLKVTQDNKKAVWQNIPLQDFTSNSDIDWSQSIPEIDQQLYAKYKLSAEEIEFIEEMIKPMK